jgi:hypothetical protein
MSGEEGGGATWERCSQHGKMCSQHEKRCSQHSQYISQHHDPTADMFPNSNRVAEKVSDPSARIGRPGASSSDIGIVGIVGIKERGMMKAEE